MNHIYQPKGLMDRLIVTFKKNVLLANKSDDSVTIPKHEIAALARLILPSIQKFFESEKGKREFAE